MEYPNLVYKKKGEYPNLVYKKKRETLDLPFKVTVNLLIDVIHHSSARSKLSGR